MPKFTLKVNGRDRDIQAPAEMPLLWVLRDLLHLTGTKYGCGIAQCGACTVHLDGEPVRSCVTPVSAVGGASVTTIEGLAGDGSHPLVKAWIAEEVPQCGYCQPGQLLSAAILLGGDSPPTDEDIDRAMEGNLCRCGTYDRIRRAIRRAVVEG